MTNPWKLTSLALAAILATAVTSGTLVTTASAERQPSMEAALSNLRAAQQNLTKASADKGGHRERALKLIQAAMNEVRQGIAFDNRR